MQRMTGLKQTVGAADPPPHTMRGPPQGRFASKSLTVTPGGGRNWKTQKVGSRPTPSLC